MVDLQENKGTEVIGENSSDDEHKSYKLYNFRRPDKFSKDNLRALRDIHREFSKAISLILIRSFNAFSYQCWCV